MLSYYFGSKEGLFEAVVRRRCLGLEANINQSINKNTTPETLLPHMLTSCARFLVSEHPTFLAILVRESVASRTNNRTMQIENLTLPLRRTLGEVLDARPDRRDRADRDLCFALMLGIFAAGAVAPPFTDLSKAAPVDWLVKAVLRALGAGEAGQGATEADSQPQGRRAVPVQHHADPFEIGMVD